MALLAKLLLIVPGSMSTIFIPSGSFCLIIDTDVARAALKTLYNHLNDDGVFLFEVETLQNVPPLDVWRGSVWHKSNGQIIMLTQLDTMKDNVCYSIGKYELIDNNSIIHTEIEELKVRIYDQDGLEELLKSSGFKDIRVIEAFEQSIVYECRK